MLQLVKESTRKEKILDLIFSNSSNTRGIQIETNVKFSDHGTVIMDYVVGDSDKGRTQTSQFTTTIPEYNLDKMDRDQQQQLKDKLGELLEEKGEKMEEMEATELQQTVIDCYEEAVKSTAELRKKKDPTKKARPPLEVRRLRNIKKKSSRKLRKGHHTEEARQRLIEQIGKAEKGIRAYYKRKTEEEEEKVWRDMEKCPSNFYRYAKSKGRLKGYIGPFTREDGTVIEEEPAEVLNQEYYKIFLKPKPEEEIPEDYYDSQEDLPQEEEKWMENIIFSEEDIKKAIM